MGKGRRSDMAIDDIFFREIPGVNSYSCPLIPSCARPKPQPTTISPTGPRPTGNYHGNERINHNQSTIMRSTYKWFVWRATRPVNTADCMNEWIYCLKCIIIGYFYYV